MQRNASQPASTGDRGPRPTAAPRLIGDCGPGPTGNVDPAKKKKKNTAKHRTSGWDPITTALGCTTLLVVNLQFVV